MIPIFAPAFLTWENAGLTFRPLKHSLTNVSPADHKLLVERPSAPWAKLCGRDFRPALQKAWGLGGRRTAGILAGRRVDQGCLSFQVCWEGRKGKLGGRTCRGKGEQVFVPALWMSITEELNCQLMRFPNHVLPFKSRPPIDLIP